MKKITHNVKKIIFFILFFYNGYLQATLNGNGDFQIWSSTFTKSQINNRSSLLIFNEFRFGNNATEFFFYQTIFQYSYQLASWIKIVPSYRQTLTKNSNKSDSWYPIYEPLMELTLSHNFGGFNISDRHWILYRIYPQSISPNQWQYRNRLQIITPWKLTSLQISPFMSDEIFFTERVGFSENRFIAGLLTPFNDKVKFLVGYLLRSQKNASKDFINMNILTLSLIFGF